MTIDPLLPLLRTAQDAPAHFPPTLLFNEGWLLRLVIDWFDQSPSADHPLSFLPGATWFSEALLPSPFKARTRGDSLAESRTHLDGVIGHIRVGKNGKADLSLAPGATQLVALEAKMFSKLSATVKNAPEYDQAARNIACLAEVLKRAGLRPLEMAALGFYVLAPQGQIERGVFAQELSTVSIAARVQQRAAAYRGAHDAWLEKWFIPTLECLKVGALSWESILQYIAGHEPAAGEALGEFYQRCLQVNG